MQFDDIPESDISTNEDWPILSSATIDYPTSSEPAPISRVSQASPNDRQRPARTTNRPPRYWDESFETHFQPLPRRHCRKIQKQKSTGYSDVKARVRHDLGRGDDSKLVTSMELSSSPIETSSTHQKCSRTAHLQLKSTKRPRASTDPRYVVPRGSKAAETVINAPPTQRRRASIVGQHPIDYDRDRTRTTSSNFCR